jgi:glutaminyl-peptide cyclotransferase
VEVRSPVVAALAASCALALAGSGSGSGAEASPRALGVEVVRTLPHDPTAFTQGLELDGTRLLESTGLLGRSSLRLVERATGRVLRKRELGAELFGEGLTVVGDRIHQLTWRNGVALVYDRRSLRPLRTIRYAGEGWGICYDGRRLVTSDGSDVLTFRDPVSFRPLGRVRVTVGGSGAVRAGLPRGPVDELNELECVGRSVYANVWHSDAIVRIDAATGRVTAVVVAAGLLTPDEAESADVLNGIAFDPQRRVFLLTGKHWPHVFEVRLVPRPAAKAR